MWMHHYNRPVFIYSCTSTPSVPFCSVVLGVGAPFRGSVLGPCVSFGALVLGVSFTDLVLGLCASFTGLTSAGPSVLLAFPCCIKFQSVKKHVISQGHMLKMSNVYPFIC